MKSLVAIVTIFLAGALSAQTSVPLKMGYQGYLLNGNGEPLDTTSGGGVTLLFKLYDQAADGAALWSEAHENVAVSKGSFSVVLGAPAQGTSAPLPSGGRSPTPAAIRASPTGCAAPCAPLASMSPTSPTTSEPELTGARSSGSWTSPPDALTSLRRVCGAQSTSAAASTSAWIRMPWGGRRQPAVA